MKIIGLIGGMSQEYSAQYYRIINEEVKKLGGLNSSKCILYSVDFEVIKRSQTDGQWKKASKILSDVACSLEKAGVDFILFCRNTMMHKIVDTVQSKVNMPILHIADSTTKQINKQKIINIGLLGTNYTMIEDFYKSRIESHSINIIVANDKEKEFINNFRRVMLREIHQ